MSLPKYNAKTAIEQLEACGFQCEAGPLENNTAFIWLKQKAQATAAAGAIDYARAEELLDDPDAEDCERFASRYGRDLLRRAKHHDALLEALTRALPYVETAEADEAYKPGEVAKVTAMIRAAIRQADGGA